MATYNGEKYIREQIASILSQIKEDDELIISDDFSNDETVNVIRSIEDTRIKLLVNTINVGYTANFEKALKNASGDIIFLADQDDVWLENKVAVILKYLEKYDFVTSDAEIVDEHLNLIESSRNRKYGVKKGFLNNWARSRYIGCCMAFRKIVLDSLFPFPVNKRWVPHDIWVSLIAEFYYKTALIPEPLILYRRHESNTSGGGEPSGRPLYIKLVSRVYTLCCVLKQLRVVQKAKSGE